MAHEKPLWKMIQDAARELESLGKSPFSRRDLATTIKRDYPDVKDSSLAPMIQGVTTNLKGGSPGGVGKDILRSVGRGLFELNHEGEEAPSLESRGSADLESKPPQALPGRKAPFRLTFETDLQRFLEHDVSQIEGGLILLDREVDVERAGRIDLLCQDEKESLVVVELKIGTADDRTLGQIQRYIGWVKTKKAKPGQDVRGIVVAESYNENLRYSGEGSPVRMLRYNVRVTCQDAWAGERR